MTNLLLNFPDGYTPNNCQTEILKKIQKALDDGKKFIIVNAPTGVGKTFIAKTLGNYSLEVPKEFKDEVDNYTIFDNPLNVYNHFGCYALTITKALQDQYDDTFEDTGILKGQSNYQCDYDKDMSVDIGPCIYINGMKQQCWKENRCPYYNKRNNMLKSQFSALNYSMFFSLPEHLRQREIIVCDEGSELEDQLVGQFTCEIDLPFLKKLELPITSLPTERTDVKLFGWVQKLVGIVEKEVERMKDVLSNSGKADTFKLKGDYTRLMNLSSSLRLLELHYYAAQYLFESVDDGKKLRFIPLKTDVLAHEIFKHAKTVLIMSATIIDQKNFCKNLGITDYEYIETGSVFDPSKSPIYIMVKQKLNFSNLKELLPSLVDQVKGLLDHHKTEKGIIHTHTQYIADYIRDHVRSSRLLCREAGIKNEDILQWHEESEEPTVLVSPSMAYGVDLTGDLARFQIIMKAPWLPTKEVRVNKMMNVDKQWYANKMLCTLVQACGRGVRSHDDECHTYILDGSTYDSISKNKTRLPSFFLDRLQ